MAEGDGLLNRYTGSNPYPGFESRSLRFQLYFNSDVTRARTCISIGLRGSFCSIVRWDRISKPLLRSYVATWSAVSSLRCGANHSLSDLKASSWPVGSSTLIDSTP